MLAITSLGREGLAFACPSPLRADDVTRAWLLKRFGPDRRFIVRVAGPCLLLAGGAACAPSAESCDAPEPLAEQGDHSEWLLASAEETAAIVRLSVGPDEPVLCTATLVGRDRAITADHCSDATMLTVTASSGVYDFPIVEWTSHPIFDLAVARLGGDSLPDDVLPIAPLLMAPVEPLEGTAVETAGYGLTESGASGDLKFSVQEVASVNDELALVLDGDGSWLACAGDSGGPALLRDDQGRVRVVGVLSTGAFDCMGEGRYLYLPGFAEWIADVVEPSSGGNHTECGALTVAGRCFGSRAVFCDDGALRIEDCNVEEMCGYDIEREGFRCIAPDADPCLGVSEAGICEDGLASRCKNGELESVDCASCAGRCDRSHKSGLVECQAP